MSIGFKDFYHRRLFESPLPDDWDHALFDERVPFAKRIRYAMDRAHKVGAGSSRVAFVIPYEGRKTVLKVAKNKKGMAQNDAEAQYMSDYYLQGLNIVIPMIDYDEKNSQPTWIHTEYAEKAKDSDFIRAVGVPLRQFVLYCVAQSGRGDYAVGEYDESKIDTESYLVENFINFISNYSDIPIGDFYRLANWGIYNGKPVIVDLGLSSEVLKTYYS